MTSKPGKSRLETKAAKIARFIRLYARKAYRGRDPNDRSYDREVEKQVKSMKPQDLDRILREGED
ncbi:MAG TPA: hypothetical protein PKA55_04985 [Rhodoblastus sp.]|nr:hypothetical protein [Rhodoblastus sp.]